MTEHDHREEIRERLFALRDEKNAAFVAKLIPNIPPETILGARTPMIFSLSTLGMSFAVKSPYASSRRSKSFR